MKNIDWSGTCEHSQGFRPLLYNLLSLLRPLSLFSSSFLPSRMAGAQNGFGLRKGSMAEP